MDQEKIKKIKWSTILHLLLALVVVILTASLLLTYALPRSYSFVDRFASATPYPLIMVDYRPTLTFRELSSNMASVKRFYENQDFSKIGLRVDFSTDEGKKRFKVREKEVLNKMLEDDIIVLLAKERDIVVSQDMAHQGVARQIEEYGNASEVEKNLERLYGWTMTDFEEKIVVPSLYEEKLEQSFLKEMDTTSLAKEKIEKAKESLQKEKDFALVAKEFSQGQTAENGGELGWFTLEDLAPELRKSVALQKVGVPGDIIETSLGYHIILIEEMKKDNDKQLYRLNQIFTRKITFADWLTEKMKGMSVWVLSPEYYWNTDTARVEFKSGELKEFEKELLKKTSGDAMFFF